MRGLLPQRQPIELFLINGVRMLHRGQGVRVAVLGGELAIVLDEGGVLIGMLLALPEVLARGKILEPALPPERVQDVDDCGRGHLESVELVFLGLHVGTLFLDEESGGADGKGIALPGAKQSVMLGVGDVEVRQVIQFQIVGAVAHEGVTDHSPRVAIVGLG